MIFLGIVIGILLVVALFLAFAFGAWLGVKHDSKNEINIHKVRCQVNGKEETLPEKYYDDFNEKYCDFVVDYFRKIDWDSIWDEREKEKQNE